MTKLPSADWVVILANPKPRNIRQQPAFSNSVLSHNNCICVISWADFNLVYQTHQLTIMVDIDHSFHWRLSLSIGRMLSDTG